MYISCWLTREDIVSLSIATSHFEMMFSDYLRIMPKQPQQETASENSVAPIQSNADSLLLWDLLEKGTERMGRKKYAKALSLFSTAASLSPSYAQAWYLLGYAQQQLGKNKSAIRSYQQTLNLAPEHHMANTMLFLAYTRFPANVSAIPGYINHCRMECILPIIRILRTLRHHILRLITPLHLSVTITIAEVL